MKLLIATPAYGGQLTHHYMLSMMKTVPELLQAGIQYGFLIIPTESLISRGRNRCAQVALEAGMDKLFFIDADIGWEPEQFMEILNSSKAVIGGTYFQKQAEPRLSYNPLKEHVLSLEKQGKTVEPRTIEELRTLQAHHAANQTELEVRHVPTGFMCIDMRVLKMLQPKVEQYRQADTVDPKKFTQHWNFFPAGVEAGEYLSEDYGFCNLVRKHLTCGVYLNCNVIATHTGVHTFKLCESRN